MKVLFDQGVPVTLRQELPEMDITTAFRQGWSQLANGELLAVAEQVGMEDFVTTDQNLRYQQNLKDRRIGILVLPTTRWPDIKRHAAQIREALRQLKPGDLSGISLVVDGWSRSRTDSVGLACHSSYYTPAAFR